MGADLHVGGLLVVAEVSWTRGVGAVQSEEPVVARARAVAAVTVEGAVGGALRHPQHPTKAAWSRRRPVMGLVVC